MFLKSNNSDFHFLGFLLGILCCVFYGANTVMAHTQYAEIYFAALAMISMLLIFTNFLGDTKLVAIFFFILGFPEYGSNPYETEFFSPFYFQKYVLLLLCIKLFNLSIRLSTVFFILGLVASWLLSFNYEINGMVKNELVQLLILILLLNIKLYEANQKLIISFLLSFIAFCFISSIIIRLFDLHSVRLNGGNVYMFGHWFGILVGYFIFFISRVRYSVKLKVILSSFLCLSLLININSLQSVHFVFFILCLLISFRIFEQINPRSVTLTVVFFTSLLIISNFGWNSGSISDEYAWVSMKGLQVLNLFYLDITAISNSPLIRINEIISLFQQSNLLQIAIGRGFASTYEMAGAYWELSNLHYATFPIEQINSGSLQMVHESLTMLFKWSGLMGMIAVYLILKRSLRRQEVNKENITFTLVLLALFVLSSVHTGLLCLILIAYGLRSEQQNKRV